MSKELTVGLVGLDTSHVKAFTSLLNDKSHESHVPGAKVVAGYPGGSADFPSSINRVEGFTTELRGKYGVEILDSPEAVAERVDLLFITAVDGRTHLDYFERTIGFRKPTFIDKPFATSVANAEAQLKVAKDAGVPMMSCSSLRYTDLFVEAMADKEAGAVWGIDTAGPMNIEPTQGGLFWYGIHGIEMVVAAMGVGAVRVRDVANDEFDLVTIEYRDGRIATYRGTRKGKGGFAVRLHREKAVQQFDPSASARPGYAGMLEAIMRSLPTGRSDIPAEEMLEVVRIIEAANTSRSSDGKAVDIG